MSGNVGVPRELGRYSIYGNGGALGEMHGGGFAGLGAYGRGEP